MLETDSGKFKTLDDFEVKGKRVLVRVDFNSPLVDGKVQMNERIEQHARTLKELAEKEAKVVVLAHQGRQGKDYMESMEQHAELASGIVKMDYMDDLGEKAKEIIARHKPIMTREEYLAHQNQIFQKEMYDGQTGTSETASV